MRSSSPSSSISRRPAPSRRVITASSVSPCLRAKAAERRPALLQRLELACAVDVETAEIAGQLRRHLGELEGHRVEAVGHGAEAGVVVGDPGDRTPGLLDERHRIRMVVSRLGGDRLLGERRRLSQVFQIAEPLGPCCELVVLARQRGEIRVLGEIGAQLLGLTGSGIAIGR